eukprot:260941-Chlamydomonas_euryale.AAC.9
MAEKETGERLLQTACGNLHLAASNFCSALDRSRHGFCRCCMRTSAAPGCPVTNVTIPGLAAYSALLTSQVLAIRERTPQVRNAIRHPFYEIVSMPPRARAVLADSLWPLLCVSVVVTTLCCGLVGVRHPPAHSDAGGRLLPSSTMPGRPCSSFQVACTLSMVAKPRLGNYAARARALLECGFQKAPAYAHVEDATCAVTAQQQRSAPERAPVSRKDARFSLFS